MPSQSLQTIVFRMSPPQLPHTTTSAPMCLLLVTPQKLFAHVASSVAPNDGFHVSSFVSSLPIPLYVASPRNTGLHYNGGTRGPCVV